MRFIWIIPALVYLAFYSRLAYLFFVFDKIDAVWVVGIFGWPGSLIAKGISDGLSSLLYGHVNFGVDMAFLLLFGLIQYALIGSVIQKFIFMFLNKNIKKRISNLFIP
jgi:hypothetical protein